MPFDTALPSLAWNLGPNRQPNWGPVCSVVQLAFLMINAVVPACVTRQHTQTRIDPDVHVDRVAEVLKVVLLLLGRVPTDVLDGCDLMGLDRYLAEGVVGPEVALSLVRRLVSDLFPLLTFAPQHRAAEDTFCHLSREPVVKVWRDHVFVSTMLNAATEAVR